MNRQQRRRAERMSRFEQERNGIVPMSRSDINRLKDDAIHEASAKNVEHLMACFALVLNEEFGFGSTRITRALEAIDRHMQDIIDDKITMTEIADILEKKTGLKIVCED